MVQREITPLIDLLFTKIEDLNFRAKEKSLQTLIQIFEKKVIEMKGVLDKILFQPRDKPQLAMDKAP